MVINENNSHINSFVKGMNSDLAYDQIDNQSYTYAKNVRITKNINNNGNVDGENYASVHEGVISPVPSGITFLNEETQINLSGMTILASDSIDNIGIIITKNTDNTRLVVYRIEIDEENNTSNSIKWWEADISEKRNDFSKIESLSTVLYQELEGVIKLYIATGVYPIIEIRVDITNGYDLYTGLLNVDDFINNRILPLYPIYIDNVIDGSLKTSLVLYTYRYYNKFGITTQLAPLTNKILVIDSNRAKETGNAKDTKTSIGFSLKIKNPTGEYSKYNRLLIFRLSYINSGEDANVNLIYDGEVTNAFNDVGTAPLAELTIEEFAVMSGMVVIPKVIELNLQYLFASNVKDDTIIPEFEISGGLVNEATAKVILSNNIQGIPTQETRIGIGDQHSSIQQYLEDRNVNPDIVKSSYNNIFTSSLLRSLRRGETYSYGIVYYDKYGRRSNVKRIGDISIKNINRGANPIVSIENDKLYANVYGTLITLPLPNVDGIVGCQIVRRSSKSIYLNTVLLVALARPIMQKLYDMEITNVGDTFDNNTTEPKQESKNSPYYPTGFLWSGHTRIYPGYMQFKDSYNWWDLIKPDMWYDIQGHTNWTPKNTDYFTATSKNNNELFQIFSSEIDFRRDDVLSNLLSQSLVLHPSFTVSLSIGNSLYPYGKYSNILLELTPVTQPTGINAHISASIMSDAPDLIQYSSVGGNSSMDVFRWKLYLDPNKKISEKYIFPLYETYTSYVSEGNIKSIKDVKIPQWFDGFSNLLLQETSIAPGGIKKYKEFTTSIDNYTYDNWISFGLYDIRISSLDTQQNNTAQQGALYLSGDYPRTKLQLFEPLTDNLNWGETRGYIGPGPSCFLMTVDSSVGRQLGTTLYTEGSTVICNLQHKIAEGLNEPDEFVQYFGFGNFFKLEGSANDYKVVHNDDIKNTTMLVFDGDIYITPQEITTMYKTYDFMSFDTLLSTQITNFVPMESKVNTFFDYGMNLLNTNSSNLLIEPGSIDGVTTQDRPVHQYNLIYSANDESNDVFTLIVEKSEDNLFKLRTYYSEPKTNGEYVDNFLIFKPAAYIDVDPKYGLITNLLTDKNTLYYWQDTAFGKFSVNERSLINDLNGNTIMLGQSGILSRNDYISTKYGMREYDYCATSAENGVYWVDVNNKAVVAADKNECINLGERLNVQNIINSKLATYRPKVDYDLQNNELLCKCLTDNEQIIFNLKFNIATSIYNRSYEDILNIKNKIYGFNVTNNEFVFTRYNHLQNVSSYLNPLSLCFIVNKAGSVVKTFDSQQLIPLKRKNWNSNNKYYTEYFETSLASMKFETDINSTNNDIKPYTDREGNIVYNIPRFGENDWGNRLRGKWLKVDFEANNPTEYTTISHVITKFRQSYS